MKKFLLILLIINVFTLAQNYKVERKIIRGSRIPGELALIEFNVFGESKLLFSVNKEIDYDIPFPTGVVNNDGDLFIINSLIASVEIYRKGLKYNEIFLFGKPKVEYERSIFFSIDQSDIILALSEPKMRGSNVYRINQNGIILKESINLKNISAIKVINNYGVIIISGTSLFNDELLGKTIFLDSLFYVQKSIPGNYNKIDFYGDAILLCGKKNISILNYPELNEELKYYSDDQYIYSAEIIDNSLYSILYGSVSPVNGKWIFKNGELVVIKKDGRASKLMKLGEFIEAKINVGQDGKIEPILK